MQDADVRRRVGDTVGAMHDLVPSDDPDDPVGRAVQDEPDDEATDELTDDPLLDEFDAEMAAALADRSEILPSSGVQKFRRNTAVGAVLNGMALGLRDVFEPVQREEAPIVQDALGEPDTPRHVDAHLDPDDPAASSVTVRPWLSSEIGPDGRP